MYKESIATDKAPKAIGPYSQAIMTNEYIFVSGQLPIDPISGKMSEDIAKQAKQSLENIKAILESVGSNMDKVVKTTVLLKNMADFGTINEEYAKFFTANYPARACYEVAVLPKGAGIEIEAIAMR